MIRKLILAIAVVCIAGAPAFAEDSTAVADTVKLPLKTYGGGAFWYPISGPIHDQGRNLGVYGWAGGDVIRKPNFVLIVAYQYLSIEGIDDGGGMRGIAGFRIHSSDFWVLTGGGYLNGMGDETRDDAYTYDVGLAYSYNEQSIAVIYLQAIDRAKLGTDLFLNGTVAVVDLLKLITNDLPLINKLI